MRAPLLFLECGRHFVLNSPVMRLWALKQLRLRCHGSGLWAEQTNFDARRPDIFCLYAFHSMW